MLVLKRRKDQSLFIGGRLIEVRVLDVNNGNVKIGIVAPKDISVDREEVLLAKERRESTHEEANEVRPVVPQDAEQGQGSSVG